MQLFWCKGYAATSIEDLLEALQISRSSLYDTFGDKRSLFLTALRAYSQNVIQRMGRVLVHAPTPIAAVEMILGDLVASAGTAQGAQGCFMVNSVAELAPFDAEVTQIAAEYARTVQDLLAGALRKAAAEGIPLSAAPEQLSTYVFNATQGMRLLIKAGAPRDQVQAVAEITMRALAHETP